MAKMQFSTKLFVSLVLPAAITILVSFLWLKKKSQEAEERQQLDSEERDVNKDEENENNADEITVTESEICQTSEDTVDAEPSDVQRFPLEKQSSTTESAQQDSGVETKPSISSELKELSGGEESLSEGSVDSSTLYTDGFSNDTPPPLGDDNNGNKSRKGVQNGDKDVWEIEFPQILCGRLIGRKGKNVRVISEKSGAKIRLIPQSPGEVSTHRIISISGSSSQIQSALDSIHEKFPCVPLTRLNLPTLNGTGPENAVRMQQMVATTVVPTPQAMPFVQAMLPSVANFDVVVTSVADAGHFFVQLHNDFMQRQLQDLHQNMLQCYGQGTAPLILPLPQPIVVGSCCAAPAYTYNGWYRAQVLGPTANPDEVEVKYLDYGGYGRIAASSLRQLRADFLTLPFQAIECYLANVVPLQGDTFSSVANAVLEDMTMNAVLTCRLTGHRSGLPCLELYLVQGQQTILINRELVNRGLARWAET